MEPQPSSSQESPTHFIFPKQKRPKVTSFTLNEKNMIMNTYKYVAETWPSDKYPYRKEIANTAANILGIGVASVYRILKDFKEHVKISLPVTTKSRPTFSDKIDDFTKSAIRKKVHAFFLKGQLPTVSKVLKDVNEDVTLPNYKRTTFQKILKFLNFKFNKRKRNNALIDGDDIVLWRREYLHKIKKSRDENRRIFYVHETLVNTGHTVNNSTHRVGTKVMPRQQMLLEGLSTHVRNPTSKGNQLIIVLIGNEDGFIEDCSWVFESKGTSDYNEVIDPAHFEKWFGKVLPKLGENAVVVMDNAPYQSRRKEIIPDTNWLKADIQKWLCEKYIKFDDNEIKVQLLNKVQMVKDQYQLFVVDELARIYGVEVLRLPPYHCDLNPTELILADVLELVVMNNTTAFQYGDIKDLLREGISKVTLDQWKKCIEHIQKEEEKLFMLDYIMDDLTDKVSDDIDVTDSDSTDSAESIYII